VGLADHLPRVQSEPSRCVCDPSGAGAVIVPSRPTRCLPPLTPQGIGIIPESPTHPPMSNLDSPSHGFAACSSQTIFDLTGKRCAVIGSTSGIGHATAWALARAGADVVVHGRSKIAEGEALARAIAGLGRRSRFIAADLADPEGRSRLLDDAWNAFNGLDAWLHFAGADLLTGPEAHWSFEAKLERLWRVDVEPAILLCRAVGRRMFEDPAGGAIVTMGWDQAETGMEGDSGQAFGATKGAIHAFTKALAVELAPKVRVNAVAPGWIKTAWGRHASDAWQRRAIAEAPLARWGTPEDVAHAALFLVSPASSFWTGQIMRVNGGAVR